MDMKINMDINMEINRKMDTEMNVEVNMKGFICCALAVLCVVLCAALSVHSERDHIVFGLCLWYLYVMFVQCSTAQTNIIYNVLQDVKYKEIYCTYNVLPRVDFCQIHPFVAWFSFVPDHSF